MAAGSSQEVQLLIDLGVVQHFIQLLRTSSNIFVLDNVVWCLGNIAGDSDTIRNWMIDEGSVEAFVSLYLRGRGVMPMSKLKDLVWACGNFVKGTNLPPFEKVQLLMEMFVE